MYFNVSMPTGRAKQGLAAQPNPPGEKWRVCFSYTALTFAAIPFARETVITQSWANTAFMRMLEKDSAFMRVPVIVMSSPW
jgi:hypothetical protein